MSMVILTSVLRHATLIHPSVHSSVDNLMSSPHSLSCRGGLRPPRYTSPRSDEWGEVYLWLHGALFLLWRPPAHRRLITHLSTERTLDWSSAPLLRYTTLHYTTQTQTNTLMHIHKHACTHWHNETQVSLYNSSLWHWYQCHIRDW